MLLFFQILFTMFIAEMGDKTQLLMIAMTSRFKLRDILLGAAASILALNGLAVCLGAVISSAIPLWLIKIIAALAFFYFAWSTLTSEEDDDEEHKGKDSKFPILTVFGTFFLAELGDKTQLTAITFAASEGGGANAIRTGILIWLACSIGLFLADLIGMMAGHIIQAKTPEGFLDKLAFLIFAFFGFTTMSDGVALIASESISWFAAVGAFGVFVAACAFSLRKKKAA